MRADDEHDPLDSWLNQQVQPLPPPPGTFELITRRARGRKRRKLALTVVSAAAVAAAVAIAVPVGLNLHLTPSPTNGNVVAAGSSTTATPSQSINGNASNIESPSPSTSAPQPAVASSPLPVPGNFQPSSVTFISEHTAWVIGQAGTPGSCANSDPDICTSIARTDNAGQSWQGGAAPDTSGPRGATGVSGIRFLNQSYGWAFGPELWATDDGAKTWTPVNTNGARVTDLEASGGRAYALFATCTTPENGAASSFAAGCTSYTLMTATAGRDDWVRVGAATSGLTNGGTATSAVLELTGSNGYLLAPDGTLYSGPIGGTWSRMGTAPCQPGTAQANGLPLAAQLALASPAELDIACNQQQAADPPALWGSDSSGASWTQLPAGEWSDFSNLGGFGTATALAAAPNGNMTLATTTGIYVFSTGTGRWQSSNATGSGAPPGGFSYVGMTTDEQGVALPADTSLHEVWMTFDGGGTWKSVTSAFAAGN